MRSKAMAGNAFIGFGEAAIAFVTNWSAGALAATRGYDVKSADASNGMAQRYAKHKVTECLSAQAAVAGSELVFSLVTVDQAGVAAQESAPHAGGALYLDCNSCSPGTKRTNRAIVESQGGLYVDVAVMSPVHPLLNRTPLLLSGQHAARAKERLDELGMNADVIDGEVGTASSVKMVRSIFVKGLEAVSAECALAGKRAGVDQLVFASLEKTYPEFGVIRRAGYMLERMMRHGRRRASEMAEVARTVDELDLPNDMSRATSAWQQRIGELDLNADDDDYRVLADRILKAL